MLFIPISAVLMWIMNMETGNKFTQRKKLRLQNFDYSSYGAYFITICTKDRKNLFAPVGADSISALLVEKAFLETIQQYNNVDSPIYAVMPNHFHAIIVISRADMEFCDKIRMIFSLPYAFGNCTSVQKVFDYRIYQTCQERGITTL